MAEDIGVQEKVSRREAVMKWKAVVADYQKPVFWRASWQIVNSVGTYVVLWYLMYLSLSVSWWLTIPLAILAGGILIRVFIIFHDCGHGSFFKSEAANDFWGFITGVLTFTPYHHWRWEHSVHHSTSGNLDRRGLGDVWTMTVEEYLQSSRSKKFRYRVARDPIVLFVLAPILMFLFWNRIPKSKANRREQVSVWVMTLALIGVAAGLIAIYGFLPWLIIQTTTMTVAGSGGVWMFYVQHQFEETYWEQSEKWDYTAAAMEGSSFYKLPKVLQWFTGNIGFHHVHHLSPKIPNYSLELCHDSDPMFEEVVPMTFFDSLKTINARLWDEKTRKAISFRQLKRRMREKAGEGSGVGGVEVVGEGG